VSLRLFTVLAVMCLAVLACGTDPDTSSETGRLVVSVVNAATHALLDGATVQAAGQSRQTVAGVASFDSLPKGTQQISASLDGYVAQSAEVEIVAGAERAVTIELEAGTGPPPAPQNVRAATGNNGQVWLEWTDVPGASGYRVYVATSPGVNPQTISPVEVPLPEPNFSPLFKHDCPAQSTCYYVVRAVNAAGEGPPSLEVAGRNGGIHIAVQISFRGAPVESQLLFLGDTVGLTVSTQSVNQVVEVTAHAAARDYQLAGIPGSAGWGTTLLLEGVPHGPVVLTVTARDVNGNVSTQSTQYFLDRLPKLTVIEPLDFTVARPQVRVRLLCHDDGSFCAIDVFGLSSGGGHFTPRPEEPLDVVLTAQGGGIDTVLISARDSVGSGATARRIIPFETSQRLVEVAVAPGRILDASADRLLWADSAQIAIQDRASGGQTMIFGLQGKRVEQGFLTPSGALFEIPRAFPSSANQLFDWRGGTALSLGDIPQFSLQVNGSFAAWYVNTQVFRRDLTAGTTTTVATDFNTGSLAVGPNGDVIYGSGSELRRVRNGAVSVLVSDGFAHQRAVTDGLHVVYDRYDLGPSNQHFLILNDDSVESVLAGPFANAGSGTYAVTNGWIAYTRLTFNLLQVWVRPPDGGETQASFLGNTSPIVERLASDGKVFFETFDRRYLAVPPYSPNSIDVSGPEGRGVFIDGQPFLVIGRSLFAAN
jgi:hypothetical protein